MEKFEEIINEINPEEIAKPMKSLRVIATKHVRSDNGESFCTYKCVANPKKKLMTLKFTRLSGFPAKALENQNKMRFVLLNPQFNIDFNNLYPTVWITGYESFDENFDAYSDVLTLCK